MLTKSGYEVWPTPYPSFPLTPTLLLPLWQIPQLLGRRQTHNKDCLSWLWANSQEECRETVDWRVPPPSAFLLSQSALSLGKLLLWVGVLPRGCWVSCGGHGHIWPLQLYLEAPSNMGQNTLCTLVPLVPVHTGATCDAFWRFQITWQVSLYCRQWNWSATLIWKTPALFFALSGATCI